MNVFNFAGMMGPPVLKISTVFLSACLISGFLWAPTAHADKDISLKTADEKAQPELVESLRQMVMIEQAART